jgi:hypothetical protein
LQPALASTRVSSEFNQLLNADRASLVGFGGRDVRVVESLPAPGSGGGRRLTKNMLNILTRIDTHRIWFREEPESDSEWEWFDKEVKDLRNAETWVWASVFLVPHRHTATLMHDVTFEIMNILGEPPFTGLLTPDENTAVLIWVPGERVTEARDSRLWMACMRIAHDHECHGVQLLSAVTISRQKRSLFNKLIALSLDIG